MLLTSSRCRAAVLPSLIALLIAGPAWGAFNARFAHTATLLPDGNILVVGGSSVSLTAAATMDVQILLRHRDGAMETDSVSAASLAVARASHTATLLPNGEVLVAGGLNPGGVLNSAVAYNPKGDCWRPAVAMNDATGRFNHTATLLRDPVQGGKVLLCGGVNNAGSVVKTCEIFTPAAADPTCASAPGSFSGSPPSLSIPRSVHTATTLSDGRVFFAGGFDPSLCPTCSVTDYIVTTEIYNPASGSFSPSRNLIQRRAAHTASLMGNGKVLIAGGINEANLLHNKGMLQTVEIYDPIADSMSPAAPMQERKLHHTAEVDPNGGVMVYGGLGNITTSYPNLAATLNTGSFVTGSFAPSNVLSTMNITGGRLLLPVDFKLSVEASGIIENGVIVFSSPIIAFPGGGAAYFPPGQEETVLTTTVNLRGVSVGCDDKACGKIQTVFAINPVGQYFIGTQNVAPLDSSLTAGSAVSISGSIDSTNNPALITGGALNGILVIKGLPKQYIGGTISSGTLILSAATISTTTFKISISVASSPISGTPTVISDGGTGGQITFNAAFAGVTGTVQALTDTAVGPNIGLSGRNITQIAGTMKFVVDRVDLSDLQFKTDVATVIINSMMFGDAERYSPKSNKWTLSINRNVASVFGRYNHAATLTETGEIVVSGGQTFCDGGVTCFNNRFTRELAGIVPKDEAAWNTGAAMSTPRANHTATLLPDGTILAAGGSNGPNLLDSSETFDPLTQTYSLTANRMHDSRDLHSATLLTNGRVLVAGGFSTTPVSTGTINGAEIYYPDTRLWVHTQPMSSSRDNHAAVLLPNGNVLVTGGYVDPNGTYLNGSEIYISTAGYWINAAPMTTARALHTATLLPDGRILVMGGLNNTGVQNSVEIYDPAADSWTAKTNMPRRLHGHRATMLPDGRVLTTGGNDGSGEVSLTFIYNPLTDAWGTSTPMSIPRANHTATLLPNGVVVVAGGAQALLGNSLNSVEAYYIASSTWALMGILSTPRAYHATVLGLDGNLYAIGGSNGVTFLDNTNTRYFSDTPDLESVGFPPSLRKSSITAVDVPRLEEGKFLTLTGKRFAGFSEAAGGGAASANSSHDQPKVVLQALESSGGTGSQGGSSYFLDLTTRIFDNSANLWTKIDSSITVQLPSYPGDGVRVPYGWYNLRTAANGVYSDGKLLQAGPAKPGAAPTGLAADPATVSSNTINWSWTAVAPPLDGYNIYSATSGVILGTAPVSATPGFRQTGLEPNTTALIMVAAYTLSGDGPLALSSTFYTLPNAPTNITVSEVASDKLTVNWDANNNAASTIYEVSDSTDNFTANFSTPIPTVLEVTSHSVVVASLFSNTTYYFRLRAFNGFGLPSNFSAVVSTITRAPVSAISGNAQSPSSIQWNWPDPGGVSFYKVYNATNGALIATSSSNVYNQTNLSTNTMHSIIVSAVTSAEGPLTYSPTVYTLVAVPSSVSPAIVNVSTGGVGVVWGAGGNPLGTQYEMIASSAGVIISTIATIGFTAQVSGIDRPATTLDFAVRALNGDGIPSGYLPLGRISTLANPPINLRVLGTTPSSISVAWDRNNNSSSATYQVTYSTDDFIRYVSTPLAFSALSNQNALVIAGLVTATTYTIRAAAQNPDGVVTAFSNSVTTSPFNGGVAVGSVGGPVLANEDTLISGTLGDGRAITFHVPANAFPSNTFITISSITIPPSPCGALGSAIGVAITPQPDLQPTAPIFLGLGYAAGELGAIPASEAALMRLDASGRCVPLKTTIDTANRLLTAQLNHMSVFQVAQVPPSATLDTALIFPNPFYPSRGNGFVTFSALPAGSRVRLFTTRGELVFDDVANASGLLTWNGVNKAGHGVASGVYIAVVSAGGSKKIFKVAVLR